MANEKKIMSIIDDIKNGTLFYIEYRSDVPVTKDAKKNGITIEKITKKLTRTGINYANIKEIKNGTISSGKKHQTAKNYSWIVDNKVTFNSNTNKKYFRIARVNGRKENVEYRTYKNGKLINVDSTYDTRYTIGSYNGNAHGHIVQNIAFDNIISIKHINVL